jgi:hypothetical protein
MSPTVCGFRTTLAVLAVIGAGAAVAADEDRWPRRLDTDRGRLTIYQPQPESFEANLIKGRAAASLQQGTRSEPEFGVFWFAARVDTDREAGTAVLRDIVVTDVRWPDSTETEEREVAEFLTGLMPTATLPIALELLTASLATAEIERASLDGLRHEPPEIVVVEELAELLLYDGEPRAIPVSDTGYEQIINSAFAVIHDQTTGSYYLAGGEFWYTAIDPRGPWTPTEAVPAGIVALVPASEGEGPVPTAAPRIVVATVPTELIASDGPPDYRPIGSGELLYVANTETPVLREVASGSVFLLLSGRWYRAESLAGPWAFVRPDELPTAFQSIPPDSALGSVRASVAGTAEADAAVLDAYVPQTAAVDRGKATLEVEYDGEPMFESIDGTAVAYATNTAAQVLLIDGKYYACDDGVWFAAEAATGPWSVAESVPMDEIKKIPPSSPVYNVRYVEVYESTPTVVYVGYTPGYMWSYPWYGVPIYGTGWYYPPYWGAVYYPRPVTYGIHVSYNPWTGWGMGFSYSWGFMTVGIAFGGGYGGYYRPGYPPGVYFPPSYYPPGGYRPPHYPPNHRPGAPRPTPYAGSGRQPGASQLPAAATNNLYQNARNSTRATTSNLPSSGSLQSIDRGARGSNNIYADTAGNLHRQSSGGWDSRSQGAWQSSSPSTREAPSNLNRDYNARQTGASRSTSRPAPRGGGFGGGGFGGGGGGFRR